MQVVTMFKKHSQGTSLVVNSSVYNWIYKPSFKLPISHHYKVNIIYSNKSKPMAKKQTTIPDVGIR